MIKAFRGYVYSDVGDMASHEFLIYNIIRGIKPKAILEIGIRAGVSTMAICRALEDQQAHGIEYHCCDIDESCKRVQRSTPIPLTFHIMSSNELANKWTTPLDVLFIDGYHKYEQVRLDYNNFSPFVNKDGFIFFHDTFPGSESRKTEGWCWDAYKILEDLKKDTSIEFVTFPYSYGLTVCRKLVRG